MEHSNSETHIIFATVVDAVKLYSYQTGFFPVTSIKGVKYVFILYYYDANEILSHPLKIRTGKDILHTYTKCRDYLKERGICWIMKHNHNQ